MRVSTKWQRMWRGSPKTAGRREQNAGEDVIKRMKTGGLPVGKKESQDLAWKRVLEFFKRHLG
jgi:dienelactone hydrolase